MSYATKLYQKNNINHAQAIDLVIDIYEEAVNVLEEALQAMHDNRIQDRFIATEKARKYLIGLSSSLFKETEETQNLSKTLENYYSVVNELLTRINVYNRPEICLAAIESLKEMAGCWREVKFKAQDEMPPRM